VGEEKRMEGNKENLNLPTHSKGLFLIRKMIAWKYHKETPCIATFILNKQKCHVFLFIFSLSVLQNQGIEGQNRSCPGERVGTSGRGEVAGEGG
jgi:hypothetical protein